MPKIKYFAVLGFSLFILSTQLYALQAAAVKTGDSQPDKYLPLLSQQRVAVFANSASQFEGKNIVDILLEHQIKVTKIFSPEHGFNALSDAGAQVMNSQESNSQITIVSLYGKKDKPSAADLADVDVIVFDIQDVGVRFYTYISSLQKIMEAALENNKRLIILDRPNPNSFYIDGPVLEKRYKSFVGMQPVPIVYGMTIGEYAKMLVGEQWLKVTPPSRAAKLKLNIIPLQNYSHNLHYQLNSKPSPNLANMTAVYLYPSLGLFEGTKLSVGRGTAMPFQVIGSPNYKLDFSFTPRALPGALNPPYKDQLCHGWDFQISESAALAMINKQINLQLLIAAYQKYTDKATFFSSFITKLAGTATLQQQISSNIAESQIRASWQPGILQFKKIRSKYLLYPDT